VRSPRSLRSRLVLVTLALTAIGLIVAGFATYGALRSFLVDRVDTQLRDTHARVVLRALDRHRARAPWVEPDLLSVDRTLVGEYSPDGVLSAASSEAMPRRVRDGFQTVRVDGERYRVYASSAVERAGPGDRPISIDRMVAVAAPMDDVSATLGRLVVIELIVGALVLAGAGALGLALVRVGLRPLTDIENTAGAIAEGDLTRRIDDEATDTEVGRLGRSLNVMLERIEESFAEREASERRLRQFVADASHELQTPLTSVRGYAELFRRGAADRPEDLATAMRRIEAEAERMGVLVDDLLLLARLDQGRPLAREPVDLAAAVRDLAGDSVVVDPGHPVDVDASSPVEVIGDEVRLRQVVSNLLGNARRHTPGGTRVTVAVARVGEEAVLTVRDEGPGLAPEHAARVFERFYRSDASRVRASGGTGLGLAIVAAIAEAHGGSASVASRPGAGATFTVRLPVSGPPEPDPVA